MSRLRPLRSKATCPTSQGWLAGQLDLNPHGWLQKLPSQPLQDTVPLGCDGSGPSETLPGGQHPTRWCERGVVPCSGWCLDPAAQITGSGLLCCLFPISPQSGSNRTFCILSPSSSFPVPSAASQPGCSLVTPMRSCLYAYPTAAPALTQNAFYCNPLHVSKPSFHAT